MQSDTTSQRHYPPKPADAYLFATCLVDQFAPEAGLDAVRLLEREGIAVHFPREQTCCGQPAYTSGYPDEARAVARLQLGLFPKPWPVVVPSGSCAAMLRHHYPRVFSGDPVLARAAADLAERVFELTEFLVHVVGFRPSDTGEPCSVALHTSCHARREMGVHETSQALLAGLSNVKLVRQAREEECCGFGGTFALRHSAISEAIVTEKVAALKDSGARTVVSADCGCLLNILGCTAYLDRGAGQRQPSLAGEHIASFLWRRTGGAHS